MPHIETRAEERQERKRQRAIKIRVDGVIKNLLATPDGREFFRWLMSITGINQQPYANNALQTSFNCGLLQSGLLLQDRLVEASPDGFIRLLQEMNNDRREFAADADRDESDPESDPDSEWN